MSRALLLFSFLLASIFLLSGCSAKTPCVFSQASPSLNVAKFTDTNGLDPTFGTFGRTWTGFGKTTAIQRIFLTPDGEVYVAGKSDHFALIAHYLQDGSADPKFGTDGKLTIDAGFTVGGLAFQTSGKLVIAGMRRTASDASLVAMRVDTAGNPDPSFGTSGLTEATFSQSANFAFSAVGLQTDDSLTLVGTATTVYRVVIPIINFAFPISTTTELALFRTDANGIADGNFGTSGQIYHKSASAITFINAVTSVAINADGSVFLAGDAFGLGGDSLTVAKLLANGDLDSSFGFAGTVQTSVSGTVTQAFSVAVTSDAKIVATGAVTSSDGSTKIITVRYLSDGSADTGFGDQGQIVESGDTGTSLSGLTLLPLASGNLMVAGYYDAPLVSPSIDAEACLSIPINERQRGFVAYRYLSGGAPDPVFGSNGKVSFDFAVYDSRPFTLLYDPSTLQTYVGGVADGSFALARLLP